MDDRIDPLDGTPNGRGIGYVELRMRERPRTRQQATNGMPDLPPHARYENAGI